MMQPIHSRVLVAVTAAAALLAGPSTFAHERHEAKKPRASATKEQQPWGIVGKARDVERTIDVAMTDDMRFSPSSIDVKQGETIRFVLRNQGKLMHEMVIGTAGSLREHSAMMQKHPGMDHEEPYMAHVAPGRRGELVWKFNRTGDFDFACLIPGHYQAGMVGGIEVAEASAAFTQGEVRKVDKASGRITLKHGEIKNLDMPPMTMAFSVADKALLEQVKVGDRVQFRAASQDGRMTVTEIRPAQ